MKTKLGSEWEWQRLGEYHIPMSMKYYSVMLNTSDTIPNLYAPYCTSSQNTIN